MKIATKPILSSLSIVSFAAFSMSASLILKKVFARISLGLFAIALTACSSGVKLDDVSSTTTPDSKFAAEPWNDPKSPLFQRSIYFDYDDFSIQPKYQGVTAAAGSFLKQNPTQKILIQGNTDDRGTSEYNLALGQRRADAVRKALLAQGVPESQMEAVSLGKEKPKAEGNTENAWAENRRADIIYLAK